MDIDKIIIIFSAYDNRAVASFIRILKEHGISYSKAAKNKEDSIFATFYQGIVILTLESPLLNIFYVDLDNVNTDG